MKATQLKIGDVTLNSNILQAPLAGYTDYIYRENCIKYGAGLCYTEMVSAKGLFYNSERTKELLYVTDKEHVKATQIFGEDADIMRAVCEGEYLKDFDIIDINMGCPVPKLFKNGEGAALMQDIRKAEKIVSECVKSGRRITVKTRIGLTKDKYTAVDMAKAVENAGALAITIHGRVRDDYYSGEPDYNAIYNVKRAVSIPVIANGGIFDKATCDKLYNETGADGVMIARGSIGRPWIFAEVQGQEVSYNLKQTIFEHIDGLTKLYDDDMVAKSFRKFLPHYLKGIPCKEARAQLMQIDNTCDVKKVIDSILP